MKRKTRVSKTGAALILIAYGTFWMPAVAQAGSETYRCGNTYTDRPCEGGRQLAIDDARTEADRRAADTATRRAEARADQLERIRLSQEKEAYERSRRSAHDARQAAIAERRLASSERLAQARARKLDAEPHKSSPRFSGAAKENPAPAPGGSKKRRKPSSSAG
ncbi:hypothetical protein J7E49_23710 [Variovorax paradoxus]|nr:hypothetical protein [Variovorax paradoxus]